MEIYRKYRLLYHYSLEAFDRSWIGVHRQTHVNKSKSQQRHTSLKFAAFHNQSPLLTMIQTPTN